MLNNHLGTVKRLLQEENVDVNGKDDKGRTLLAMVILDIGEPNCVDFARFLLNKGADINLADVDQATPLHVLAATKYKRQHTHNIDEKQQQREMKEFNKRLLEMIDLLLSRGGDLTAKTENGMTPFEVALDCDNINVLQKFSSSVKLNQSP